MTNSKKEYWASYATDDSLFNEGGYSSIEEAKADIIDQYKADIEDGTYEKGDISVFYVGERIDIKDIAKDSAEWYAESAIEHIGCSIEDEWHMDYQSILTNDKNIALMTKLLNQFFDECDYENSFPIKNIQEFKFDEVIND